MSNEMFGVLKLFEHEYNENSRVAAYWRKLEHDAYKTNAMAAAEVDYLAHHLFEEGKHFRFVMVREEKNEHIFEWRRMEVIE